MREIKIKRLSLENFKCHEKLTVVLDGANASIYGDNASGKTSVYDGLCWLLFGKDSAGNGEKTMEIKPLGPDGTVKDHLAVTAVEAVLDVNGEEVRLRRTCREVWSTKKGSDRAGFDGNTCEFYVDGVPCKKNGFQQRVGELVDEETFRMLTSVSYFASQLGWQERRARLFDLAGAPDDKRILRTQVRFAPLAEGMGNRSPEEYRKKLLAEKKRLAGAKSEIPARISECRKTVEELEGVDFEAAKVKLEEVKTRKEELVFQLLELGRDGAREAVGLALREVQLELAELERKNRAFRENQTAGQAEAAKLRLEISGRRRQKDAAEQALLRERAYMEQLEKQLEQARMQWQEAYRERFHGGVCRMCGQQLPAGKLEQAKAAFENQREQRLAELEERTQALRAETVRTEERIREQEAEIYRLEAEICCDEQALGAMEAGAGAVRDEEGYREKKAALQSRVMELNKEMEAMDTLGSRRQLQRQLEAAEREMAALLETAGRERALDYARGRMEQLRRDEKNGEEALEQVEQLLYLMDEYSRYKTRFVEQSINGCFRIARFRLFREQANGGVEDRCDVVHEGVPYLNVNNGMKINLGIDIINTLSAACGVRVPLFVDNAEGVTRLESCGSQMIRLVVSEGERQLRVCREGEGAGTQ